MSNWLLRKVHDFSKMIQFLKTFMPDFERTGLIPIPPEMSQTKFGWNPTMSGKKCDHLLRQHMLYFRQFNGCKNKEKRSTRWSFW